MAVEPASVTAVSLEKAQAFSLFFLLLPTSFYYRGYNHKVSIGSGEEQIAACEAGVLYLVLGGFLLPASGVLTINTEWFQRRFW